MKAKLIVIPLVVLIFSCSYRPEPAPNEIEYRGEKIKLTKSYSDFDDYKNDPENIDPAETMRVQRLVMQAPIDREFESLIDASKAIGEIAFPGYGSGVFPQQRQPDGTSLIAFSIEIPRAEKDRWFVFRAAEGKHLLIDEFVAPDVPLISRVAEENGVLVYKTVASEKVLTRPLVNQK